MISRIVLRYFRLIPVDNNTCNYYIRQKRENSDRKLYMISLNYDHQASVGTFRKKVLKPNDNWWVSRKESSALFSRPLNELVC